MLSSNPDCTCQASENHGARCKTSLLSRAEIFDWLPMDESSGHGVERGVGVLHFSSSFRVYLKQIKELTT